MAHEVRRFIDDQQIVVVMNDLKKFFLNHDSLKRHECRAPVRKTLGTPPVWRIMRVGERKVESLAASDFDAGFCPHPLARVATSQFQRLLRPGVLRRSLFSEAAGL